MLIHCVKSTITIHVMNVSKQAGAVDCALFSMATVTSLDLGDDPVHGSCLSSAATPITFLSISVNRAHQSISFIKM